MQFVYFVISCIIIVLTAFIVLRLIEAEKGLNCALSRFNEEFDTGYKNFKTISEIIRLCAKMSVVCKDCKDSLKELKKIIRALLPIKKLIDIYNLMSGFKTAKKISLFLIIKKLLFK